MMKPRVMIATPTTGSVKAPYVHAILRTVSDLAANSIEWLYSSEEGGDLILQRNILATRFLAQPGLTHLFFVDSDMTFESDLCRLMMDHNKPIIAGIYQTKNQDPSRRRWLSFFKESPIYPENGVARCAAVPMGCTLIQRTALERMIASGVERQSDGGDAYYNFFSSRHADAATGQHISEDHSFSRRWTIDCRGDLWVLLDAKIGHVGDFRYGGDQSYLSSLTGGQLR
jgi:hypothetical protein